MIGFSQFCNIFYKVLQWFFARFLKICVDTSFCQQHTFYDIITHKESTNCANFSTFWHNTLKKSFLNSQVKCFLKFIIQAKFIYRCHVYEIFWMCAKKIVKNSSYAKMVDKLRVAALRDLELFPGFWSNMSKCVRPFMKSTLKRVNLILIMW